MGSSSKSATKSSSTNKRLLGNTTTKNPFVVSSTNNDGTNSYFVEGSTFDTINDFVNDNFNNVLNNYLNPNINDTTNQTKLNNYIDTVNKQAHTAFENNIINPLSNRNMIRSSQATDMYNNLQNSIDQSISDYTIELLGSSQENAAKVLNNLMSLYLNGFNAVQANQAQSLNASNANANTSSKSTSSQSKGGSNALDNAINLSTKIISAAPLII